MNFDNLKNRKGLNGSRRGFAPHRETTSNFLCLRQLRFTRRELLRLFDFYKIKLFCIYIDVRANALRSEIKYVVFYEDRKYCLYSNILYSSTSIYTRACAQGGRRMGLATSENCNEIKNASDVVLHFIRLTGNRKINFQGEAAYLKRLAGNYSPDPEERKEAYKTYARGLE